MVIRTSGNGVSEDLIAIAEAPVSAVERSARFNPAQRLKKFIRLDCGDGSGSQPRE